ncbi:UNVERIFIED_CONTAM: hypothetical protein FKN15_036720 [Acipenser sinensis]
MKREKVEEENTVKCFRYASRCDVTFLNALCSLMEFSYYFLKAGDLVSRAEMENTVAWARS